MFCSKLFFFFFWVCALECLIHCCVAFDSLDRFRSIEVRCYLWCFAYWISLRFFFRTGHFSLSSNQGVREKKNVILNGFRSVIVFFVVLMFLGIQIFNWNCGEKKGKQREEREIDGTCELSLILNDSILNRLLIRKVVLGTCQGAAEAFHHSSLWC